MGKLIISTHITVDGVIGPSPGDWAILEGEGERYKFDQLLAAPMNQMLLARVVVVVAGAAPILIWAAFAHIPQAPAMGSVDNRALPAVA